MKILKYSFAILVVSMIANVAMASAAATLRPDQWGVSGQSTVPKDKAVNTIAVKKERLGTQNFYNDYAETGLTSPCKNCKFIATLQRDVDGKWKNTQESSELKMDQRYYYTGNTTEATGTYRISIKRSDWTLLETTLIWDWYVQDPIR